LTPARLELPDDARRVLGVDPGTHALGWGVVEQRGTARRWVAHGVIRAADGSLADRLLQLDTELEQVLLAHTPNRAAVESIFFSKDAQSAAKLGHARGVVLLRLRRAGLEPVELAPAQVKRAVVGRGRADKRQVAQVVAAALALPQPPPSDAADALAVALACLASAGFEEALRRAGAPVGRAARLRRP
jgi:crossover junction endodeoxyribonuclease RuvC